MEIKLKVKDELSGERLINEVYIMAVTESDQTEVLTLPKKDIPIAFLSRSEAELTATRIDEATPDQPPTTVVKVTLDPPIRLRTNLFAIAVTTNNEQNQ